VANEQGATAPAFTSLETAQLKAVAGALLFSLVAVLGASLLARRVPALRGRLQASRWQMRLAIGAFMFAYNLLSRRLTREAAA